MCARKPTAKVVTDCDKPSKRVRTFTANIMQNLTSLNAVRAARAFLIARPISPFNGPVRSTTRRTVAVAESSRVPTYTAVTPVHDLFSRPIHMQRRRRAFSHVVFASASTSNLYVVFRARRRFEIVSH